MDRCREDLKGFSSPKQLCLLVAALCLTWPPAAALPGQALPVQRLLPAQILHPGLGSVISWALGWLKKCLCSCLCLSSYTARPLPVLTSPPCCLLGRGFVLTLPLRAGSAPLGQTVLSCGASWAASLRVGLPSNTEALGSNPTLCGYFGTEGISKVLQSC